MDPKQLTFPQKLLGVLKLDRSVYEQIGRESAATRQAVMVVLTVSAVYGLVSYENSLLDIAIGLVGSLIGWAVTALIIHFLCNMFSDLPASSRPFDRTLRLTGFAEAPYLLGALAFIPGSWLLATPETTTWRILILWFLITAVSVIWGILTLFTAIKEIGHLSTRMTILVMVLVLVCMLFLAIVIGFGILTLMAVAGGG